jgi:hypothetical protein
MTAVQDKTNDSSQVKIDETLQRFADGFSYVRRSSIEVGFSRLPESQTVKSLKH